MLEKDCALIIAFYGNDSTRIKALKNVLQKIRDIQLFLPKIYVVYLSFDGVNCLDGEFEGVEIIHIAGGEKNKSLFQKESLYNIGIEHSAEKYLAFLDCDIFSTDPLWLMKVYDMVDHYEAQKTNALIQMFENYADSRAGRYQYGNAYLRRNVQFIKSLQGNIPGAPGAGWATSRRILEQGGGFNQWCIPGSGDCCFVMEYTEDTSHFGYHFDYKWFCKIFRKDLGVKAILDYASSPTYHVHHGVYKHRAYKTSRYIIDHFGDVQDFVEIDENKVLAWKDPNCGLRHVLENKSEIYTDEKAFDKASMYMEVKGLPSVEERVILKDTALITCYFGDDEKLLKASKQAMEQILKLSPTPFIVFVETVQEGQKSQWSDLDDYDFVKHIVVPSTSKNKNLFHKEACFNIGAYSLPLDEYKYLIFHDSDSFPQTPRWAEIIRDRMKTWYDTNETYNFMLQNYSVYSDSVEQVEKHGYAFEKRRSPNVEISTGPGLSWSMFSEFFKENKGWYCKAFTGPNDAIAVIRWDESCQYHRAKEDWEWCHQIYKEVKNSPKVIVDYMPISITHVYHGAKSTRAYRERQQILNQFCKNVDDLVYIDENGLLAWKDENHPLAQIIKTTNNFYKNGMNPQVAQTVLKNFKGTDKCKVFCLNSFLSNPLSLHMKLEKHMLSALETGNMNALIPIINKTSVKFFERYSTKHFGNSDPKVFLFDEDNKTGLIVPNKESIEQFIKVIRQNQPLSQTIDKNEEIVFIIDSYMDRKSEDDLRKLVAELNKINNNYWLFIINYEDEIERGPQLYPTSFKKVFFVTIKGTSHTKRDAEQMLQYEILADMLSKDPERIASACYKRFFNIPEKKRTTNKFLGALGSLVNQTNEIEGELVAVGCGDVEADIPIYIQNILEDMSSSKVLHVFDKFDDENISLNFKKQFIGRDLPKMSCLDSAIPEIISLAIFDLHRAEVTEELLEQINKSLQKNGRIMFCKCTSTEKKAIVQEFKQRHKSSYREYVDGNFMILRKR